uniref:XisH family protein n=1 Tax=Hassallia byssoidea TaxID=482630 RepID=UPI001F439EC4|nr:XisH family protein [Hassalia byssoidea]
MRLKNFEVEKAIADLEQAIGQYVLYRLLLNRVDPEREIYLAISDITYDEIFNEPIGEVVISDLPMQLLVVDVEKIKVKLWIPPRSGKL